MATMDWNASLVRGFPGPVDIASVFDSLADLDDYLAADAYMNWDPTRLRGVPYNGQVLAVLNGTAQPDVYIIWEVPSGTTGAIENPLTGLFYTYAPIGGGGASMPEPPDDDQLYGRTRATGAPTGAWEQVADDGEY